MTGIEQRLTKELQPERACEEEIIEAVAALRNADLMADMIERATRRDWIAGAEAGTARLVKVAIAKAVEEHGGSQASLPS